MTAPDNAAPPDLASSAGSGAHPESGRRGGRPTPGTVLTSIGICCVVFGGLVAAVTGPLDLANGSWTAAYLVLVGGVAQCAMGQSRTRHPEKLPPDSWGWAQIGAWNLGGALVIGGSLASEPLLVDFGSVLLVGALVIALDGTRATTAVAAGPARRRVSAWVDWVYRMLLLVLAVSIPIGITLSYVRHS